MTLTPVMITFDTIDAMALARWWADQTGAEVAQENDGWFVILHLPSGLALGFQKVDDPTPGKNRIHLDLVSTDLDAEVTRLVEAGATKVEDRSMPGFSWCTLADPAGNQFCVSGPHAG